MAACRSSLCDRGANRYRYTFEHMAQLTQAFFQKILKIEGGYQAMPDDNGNWACGQLAGTKYGVSAVAYQTWVGRCPTADEMKSITESTAYQFYAWYFDRYNLYTIENQQFFELLANNTMGSPTNAARVEQRTLNKLGYAVSVDGIRGPATIAALNAAWRENPTAIYNGIRAEWIEYLKSLNKPQFLSGWLYRMNHYFPPLAAVAVGGGLILALLAVLFFRKK